MEHPNNLDDGIYANILDVHGNYDGNEHPIYLGKLW